MEEERETEVHAVEDAMRHPDAVALIGTESVSQSVARARAADGRLFPGPRAGGRVGRIVACRADNTERDGACGQSARVARATQSRAPTYTRINRWIWPGQAGTRSSSRTEGITVDVGMIQLMNMLPRLSG